MNKRIIIIASLILIAIVSVFVIPHFLKKRGLEDAIANAINRNADEIFANIPPGPERFPGTILMPISKNNYQLVSGIPHDYKYIKLGETFSVSTILDDFSSFESQVNSAALGSVFRNKSDFELRLEIADCQILEMEIEPLYNLVSQIKVIKDWIRRGERPIVLNKSYFGKLTYSLKAKTEKGYEILKELKENNIDISQFETSIKGSGELESYNQSFFTAKKPIVIAFETYEANTLLSLFNDDVTSIAQASVESFENFSGDLLKLEPNYYGSWYTAVLDSSSNSTKLEKIQFTERQVMLAENSNQEFRFVASKDSIHYWDDEVIQSFSLNKHRFDSINFDFIKSENSQTFGTTCYIKADNDVKPKVIERIMDRLLKEGS